MIYNVCLLAGKQINTGNATGTELNFACVHVQCLQVCILQNVADVKLVQQTVSSVQIDRLVDQSLEMVCFHLPLVEGWGFLHEKRKEKNVYGCFKGKIYTEAESIIVVVY